MKTKRSFYFRPEWYVFLYSAILPYVKGFSNSITFAGMLPCLVVRENCGLGPLEVRPNLAEVVAILLAQALLRAVDASETGGPAKTDEIEKQKKNQS